MTIGFEEAARGGTRRVTLPDGRELDVRIPVGVRDGQQIRLKGQGGQGHQNGPSGDLLLTLRVASHPWLMRDGSDLRMELPITLKEAVLGGSANVPTLTGSVTLTIPAGSNSGRTLRLKGKGIPAHAGQAAGDLYVKLVVMLPDKPDPALKDFASGWNADYNPRAKLG
jgi:DnaJ-class molecular chaperone